VPLPDAIRRSPEREASTATGSTPPQAALACLRTAVAVGDAAVSSVTRHSGSGGAQVQGIRMSADGSTSGGTAGAQTRHSRFLASVASANLRGDRTDSDGLRRVVVRVALTGHRGSRYDDFGNSDPGATLLHRGRARSLRRAARGRSRQGGGCTGGRDHRSQRLSPAGGPCRRHPGQPASVVSPLTRRPSSGLAMADCVPILRARRKGLPCYPPCSARGWVHQGCHCRRLVNCPGISAAKT